MSIRRFELGVVISGGAILKSNEDYSTIDQARHWAAEFSRLSDVSHVVLTEIKRTSIAAYMHGKIIEEGDR